MQPDPDDTLRYLDRPLRDPHEYVHSCVRSRVRLKGPGLDDKGRYDPESMDDWRLVVTYDNNDDGNAGQGGTSYGVGNGSGTSGNSGLMIITY